MDKPLLELQLYSYDTLSSKYDTVYVLDTSLK